ncbi:unnamed protein product [Caenorhabditis sp. 36 PRJEB53466]|nr:unnamed protein product [Caenorhabditis sp. 36 PRJEB53466]
MRSRRNFDMHMVDNRGRLLMSSSRYGGGYNCGIDQLETWHRGQSIGMLSRDCCDGNFYLRVAGCNAEFAIATPQSALSSPLCRARHTLPFPVYVQGGARVAEIIRLDPGWMEWVSDADTYMIHFPADMPPIIKLLLLQSTFLIDFTYFEDRQQRQAHYAY